MLTTEVKTTSFLHCVSVILHFLLCPDHMVCTFLLDTEEVIVILCNIPTPKGNYYKEEEL